MLKTFIRNEDGGISIISAIIVFGLLGVASLVVDMGLLYVERGVMQNAADAGALAGAYALRQPDTIMDNAVNFANLNQALVTVTGNDVILGEWDRDTRTFTAGGDPTKAILVIISAQRPTYFSSVFGFGPIPVSVSAIATFDEDINTCFLRGAKAGRDVHVGINVSITGNSCVFAKRRSHYGNGLFLEKDSVIAAPDKDDINLGVGSDIQGKVIEADMDMSFNARQMIADLEDGNYPPNIYDVVYVDNEADLPDDLEAGTAYIINGNLHIEKNYDAHDVILAVKGQVHWNDGGELTNTADVCGDPEFGVVGIIATRDIHLNKDAKASGVTMYTDTSIHVNNELTSFGGNMNAAKDIRINQSANLGGCKADDLYRDDEIAAVVTKLVD